MTPAQVEPGELVLRKPGYLEARARAVAATPVRVTLVTTTVYAGVWRLPTGELRALEAQGGGVVVSKLDAVKGPRAYFRRFEFVDAVGPVIAFAATEDVVDARAPTDPSCHAPARVEYTFRPDGDVLEQRRQRVAFDPTPEGHCVVREIAAGDPLRLERADRNAGDPTWVDAPGMDLVDTNGPPPRRTMTKKPSPRNAVSDVVPQQAIQKE